MNLENKFARIMRNSGPARVLVPIGLILIIFGVLLLGFNTDKYLETTGRITDVREHINEDDQTEYDVSFTYTVDGKQYESEFPNLGGGYKVGDDIKVFYDPENPDHTTNTKSGKIIAPIMIGLGILAGGFGILQTVKAFKKSKELDAAVPQGSAFPQAAPDGYKTSPGITEYYFRFDGNSLKPGYLIEDADRNLLFEGKMLKNALVGVRTFEFTDHTTGSVKQHDVGHTMTQTYNNEFFSMKSSFKFDGENIWDLLHSRGLRMSTNMHSRFPHLIYEVAKDGAPYAHIETTSMYVHEDDEAQHKVKIPVGRMYYRCWTGSNDFETLFLTMFAISETEQAIVE